MISRRSFLASAIAVPVLGGAESGMEWASIDEAAALLRGGKTSPVDLTRLCLDRVARLNPKLNAFVTITADQALDQARTLESELRAGKWRGPLHGIPIGLKDLYDTA